MIKSFTLLILLILFTTTTLVGQFFIVGQIIDQETGEGIPFANVSLNSVTGTASNEKGVFRLRVDNNMTDNNLKISCIGYTSQLHSLDSLIKNQKDFLNFSLHPTSILLEKVEVIEEKLPVRDLLVEVIEKTPSNYVQSPFNMEFYSRIMVMQDTSVEYLVEYIVDTYRQGYIENAINLSHVKHVRTSGSNPVPQEFDKKRNVEFFPYEKVPAFNIFMMDAIGTGDRYKSSVFNVNYHEELTFSLSGITTFENDTVFVVEYQPIKSRKNLTLWGELFISSSSKAVLKHSRKINDISLEVIYRKWNQKYFPYFYRTVYPPTKKVNNIVIFEAYIEEISTTNIHEIEKGELTGWHMSDVAYDPSYWEENYPNSMIETPK